MKLLYSGSSACDQPTFRRLLVIADQIPFMDRPSGDVWKLGDDRFSIIFQAREG